MYSYIPVRERHMRRVEQNLTEAELMEIVLCIIVRRLDMTGRALISPITLTRKHNGRNGRPADEDIFSFITKGFQYEVEFIQYACFKAQVILD